MNGPEATPSPEDDLRRDGWTVLHDAVPAALLEAITGTVERLTHERYGGAPPPFNQFELGQSRVYNLLAKDPLFAEVVAFAPVLGVAEALLGPSLQLSTVASVPIAPGTPRQPLHSDDQANGRHRIPGSPTHCTTIWLLDDFTTDNGATRLVPRSHLRPDVRDWQLAEDPALEADAVTVTGTRGSVLVYDGSTYHGGGANHGASTRRALVVAYCAGFIRPNENQTLAVPRSIARALPERVARLCGYDVHGGSVGHIDTEHPYRWLLAEPGTDAR